MADPLDRYRTPACINDFTRDRAKRRELRRRWDAFLDGAIGGQSNDSFYDPKTTPIPEDAQSVRVEWNAFPKQSEDRNEGLDARFAHADVRPNDAERQFEYCEWCAEKDPESGKIVRVTFTTEDIQYWQELWAVDPNEVLGLYRRYVNPRVQMADLHPPGDPGRYLPRNKWNTGNEYHADRGGSMHMIVGINTIAAAVGLVAGAALNPRDTPTRGRHRADPMVILSVSRVVQRLGLRLSFTDPVGIYLEEPEFNRFELPEGAPADAEVERFWKVVRGRRSRGEGLRAVFAVPEELGFTVSDLKIDGRPIEHGSQIARAVHTGTYVTPLPHPE